VPVGQLHSHAELLGQPRDQLLLHRLEAWALFSVKRQQSAGDEQRVGRLLFRVVCEERLRVGRISLALSAAQIYSGLAEPRRGSPLLLQECSTRGGVAAINKGGLDSGAGLDGRLEL
jgi:hypothetical protein